VSTSQLRELSGLSTAELKSVFQRAQSDIQLLRRLNEELKTRVCDEATDLQIDVVMRLRILQKENTGSGRTVVPTRHVPKDAVRAWLAELFQSRGINGPDARPLFRYRLTDLEFDNAGVDRPGRRTRLELEARLRARAGAIDRRKLAGQS
jgi:hypothetical protein